MMFEEFAEFIGSQEGAPPKAIAPGTPPPSEIIGAKVPRIDGPVKTTGTARYASDYNFPGMVYAVPVRSTVASGQIRRMSRCRTRSARSSSGSRTRAGRGRNSTWPAMPEPGSRPR